MNHNTNLYFDLNTNKYEVLRDGVTFLATFGIFENNKCLLQVPSLE